MQIYSIDEAFLKLQDDFPEALALGKSIKEKVKKWTGIDVSIGISKTKTLAKLANKLAKQGNGLFSLEKNIDPILEKTCLDEIWGIDKGLCLKLKKRGIFSAKDLILQDEIVIKKILRINGLKTVLELKQISCLPLESDIASSRKSFACCRSFYDKVDSLEKLQEAIANYRQIVAEKIRKQNLYAKAIQILLATSPFDKNSYSNNIVLNLQIPSQHTPDLIELAKWGTKKLFKPGFLYKRCGIILLELRKKPLQPSLLFSDLHKERNEKVIRAIDLINKRYHKNGIYFAAQGHQIDKPYKNRSPKYTGSWNELPLIKN